MDTNALSQDVQVLQEHKNEWACLPIDKKLALLEEIRPRLQARSQDWVGASVQGKQMQPDMPEEGEEWTTGPWTTALAITGYSNTLSAISKGQLLKPARVRTLNNGQVSARVFPNTIYDKILLSGITAEVWMQPGVSEKKLYEKMASFYRQESPAGKVCLVLGAGNISSISPRDVLYRLYGLGEVVILKMSPINAYLGPIFEDIFEPLIKAGYLRVTYGGSDVGHYLVNHPGVDTVHMTGAAHTFRAILFGPGEEGAERQHQNSPVIDKPFTAELGGVSPVIVVPGKWSRSDMRFQAENVVTMKLQNAGFNCVSSQVLVLAESWEQKEEFIEMIRQLMRSLPARKSYYPGAAERQLAAVSSHPEAETFGGDVPRTFISNLDPNAEDDVCFQKELFGPVFVQTSLPGDTAGGFLRNAVRFCNEKLYGTLGATIIIHPKTQKQLGQEFEAALTDLHYGSIGINIWNAAAFLLVQATWGAFPGHTTADIQSGFGIVGNSFLFDQPERTVIRGSFYPFPRTWLHGDPAFLPKPPWFVTNKTAHITARGVARVSIDPRLRYLPGILLSALLG